MDYYVNFCFQIPGTQTQHKLLEDMLWAFDHPDAETSLSKEILTDLEDAREAWGDQDANSHIKRSSTAMFIEDDAGESSYGAVADVISLWMRRIGMTGTLVFQVAFTASRHTPDAFGGGVVWINKEEAICIDTSDLARVDMASDILGNIINY